MKSSSPLLIGLLVVAVALHASVLMQDLPTLSKNGFLYDDSFYAFQIARNIAQGHGPTFDGQTPTNGFQPLYVALLVPLYLLSGSNSVLPIYLALALLALFAVATGVVLFFIMRRYVRVSVAAFSAALWTLSPVVMRQAANGLETAIAGFFFALSVYYYLARVRSQDSVPWRTFAKLGSILGLAVLARVDLGFLVLIIALDYLLLQRSRRGGSRAVRQLVVVGIAVVAVCTPWLAFSIGTTGSPILDSGSATRYLSLAYASFFDLAPTELASTGPNAEFVLSHVTRSLCVLKVNPATHAGFRTLEKIGVPLVFANLLGVFLIVSCAVWLWRRRRSDSGQSVRELDFLLLFSAVLIAAYTLYVFGIFFYLRYLFPLHIVGIIYIAVMIEDVVAAASRATPRLRVASTVAVACYCAATLYMTANARFRSQPQFHFYDIAIWIEQNTDENDTVGAFQSGAIGYLSGRHVINLDGKVNGAARAALKEGSLRDYAERVGVDIFVDHRKFLKLFLGIGTEDGPDLVRDNSFHGDEIGAVGWVAYRVPGSARSAAAAGAARVRGSRPAN